MKSKAVTQLVLLSLLCLVATPTIQAAKPVKLVEHAVYEAPFNGIWCKAVMHGTMIVKDEIPGEPFLYDGKATMLQKFILYDEEGGDIVAVVKITLQYVGTVTTFELPEDDDPTEAFYTGKMVVDVVVNVIGELADAPENSHWVVWYVAGDVVKSNGFGVLPFQLFPSHDALVVEAGSALPLDGGVKCQEQEEVKHTRKGRGIHS